jgi:hypothetical protein
MLAGLRPRQPVGDVQVLHSERRKVGHAIRQTNLDPARTVGDGGDALPQIARKDVVRACHIVIADPPRQNSWVKCKRHVFCSYETSSICPP